MTAEKMGIPAVPVVTDAFEELVKAVAFKAGMTRQRFVFVPHPVGGQPASILKEYVLGRDPVSGKAVIDEIIEHLTAPLSEEEQRVGRVDRAAPRLVEPASEEGLHRLFLERGWTDGLPIVLPTEKRLAEMLKGTSQHPTRWSGGCGLPRRRKIGNTPWRKSRPTR